MGYYPYKGFVKGISMIDYSEVGKRIKYYRQKRGLTQEQLAFDIHTSAAYISNIERSIKKPSLQTIILISEVLEISVDELLGSFQSTSPTAKESDRHSIVFSVEDKKTLTESLFTIIKILDRYS